MLSLSECQTDRGICSIIRVDPSTQDFTDKVNEACRRLMDYGNWWSTVIKASFTVYNGYVVWPRWVGTILLAKTQQREIKMATAWYDFLPWNQEDWQLIAAYYTDWRRLARERASINDLGTTPVFDNIDLDASMYLVVAARNSADYGRSVYIWGQDASEVPKSETLVLASTNVVSTNTYSTTRNSLGILRVEKDITADYVDLYQSADGTTGLTICGSYAPSETRAEYRFSRIRGECFDGTTAKYIQAMVKLRHIDAIAPTDLLSIGNRAAIKLMLQSIIAEEAGDTAGAEANAARAIHELNRELENNLPFIQTPIRYDAFNGMDMTRHSVY